MHDPISAEYSGVSAPGLEAALGRLWDVVRRKWRLIVATTVCCGLVAAVYLVRTERLYEATARLLLLQQGGRPLSVTKDEGIRAVERAEDFIPTQMAVLQSPRVVEQAIQKVGPENLPTLRGKRNVSAIEDLTRTMIKNYLKVTRPDRTASILLIKYRAASKQEATRMVEALVASYQEFLISNEKKDNGKVVSIISRARDELSLELEGLEKKYLEFQRLNPFLLEDASSRPLINSRLAEFDRAANEAMVKAMKLKSQLAIGRRLAADGAEMWAVAYAIAQVGADPGIGLIPRSAESSQGISADYLRQLMKEQQELTATYGPEYSKVKELQEQITAVRQGTREAMGRLDQGDIGQLLASIEQSLESVEEMRSEVGKQLQDDLEKAKKNAIEMTVGRNLHSQLERQKTLFFAIVDQLKQAQFGGEFGSIGAQAIERANALDQPVHPQVLLVLLGSLAFGVILGVGVALTSDTLENRIHSLEDLRQAFDLPVLGLIARITPDQLGGSEDGRLISHMLPRAPATEAYKGLRTNIEFLRRGRNVQVLLVTSSVAREGKTTTASNLAISLAHAGRKVLLVDADLRRPALGQVYRLPDEMGLSQLLQETIPLGHAAQPTQISGLDLITAGGAVDNPAELLMSGRMQEFVDEARGLYDFVIIDSSPLLAVTDPALIGASVDGVVLVLRASLLKRQLLSRAVESLRSTGTPILGTVITGIEDPAFARQYGYGYVPGADASTRDDGAVRSALAAGFAAAGLLLSPRNGTSGPAVDSDPLADTETEDRPGWAAPRARNGHPQERPHTGGSQHILALALAELRADQPPSANGEERGNHTDLG